MAGTIATKDGRVETVFDFRDALDLVEEVAGYDLRHYLEEDRQDFEEEIREEYEYGDELSSDDDNEDVEELEQKVSHYAHILKGLADEAQEIEDGISERQITTKEIGAFCKMIIDKCEKEFGEE